MYQYGEEEKRRPDGLGTPETETWCLLEQVRLERLFVCLPVETRLDGKWLCNRNWLDCIPDLKKRARRPGADEELTDNKRF